MRREPEKTVLHEVVAGELESMLAELAAEGQALPRYVEQELRRYLSCGLLAEGFVRVVCRFCGDEMVVAFSCKGRGFCPSCCGRRMSDTAAHLVDRVLPQAPYRHWVLSYPWRVRFLLARDAKAATRSASIFMQEVFRWQRLQARRAGLRGAKTGSVSFTQRFGSTLNVNVHHHSMLPDGVFVANDDASVRFEALAGPRVEDLARILSRVVRRTTAMLVRSGLLESEPDDALGVLQAETVQTGLPFAPRDEPARPRLVALEEGYSLEAGTHVHAHDRKGLEALCRYGLRPPLSLQRLHRAASGQIVIELRRARADGTRAVAFTPRQFVRRLAAIVPPPRAHLVRYHGVFAPRSALRAALVPPAPAPAAPATPEAETPLPEGTEQPASPRPRRLEWAALLQRVFEVDILHCTKCGGRRSVVAYIPDPGLARQTLAALGIEPTPLTLAKARAPPHQDSFDLPGDDGTVDPQYPDDPAGP